MIHSLLMFVHALVAYHLHIKGLQKDTQIVQVFIAHCKESVIKKRDQKHKRAVIWHFCFNTTVLE